MDRAAKADCCLFKGTTRAQIRLSRLMKCANISAVRIIPSRLQ